jgi:hypothetical protein
VSLDARLDARVLEALGRIPEIHRIRQVQLDRA